MDEDFDATMRDQISQRPRVKFVCERDWVSGPYDYRLGVFWDRDFNAQPGQIAYKRWFTVALKFRLSIDRCPVHERPK